MHVPVLHHGASRGDTPGVPGVSEAEPVTESSLAVPIAAGPWSVPWGCVVGQQHLLHLLVPLQRAWIGEWSELEVSSEPLAAAGVGIFGVSVLHTGLCGGL